MKCPADSAVLVAREIQTLRVHYCPSCRGVFVPLGQAGYPALCPGVVRPSELIEVSLPESARRISPHDGNPMRVFHYQGVEIDYCMGSDAIWLDPGELEKLVDLAQARGAEKKRRSRFNWMDNPVVDGIDAAFTSIDVLDLLGDAISGLFDAF